MPSSTVHTVDLPASLTFDDAPARSWVSVAKLGRFTDPRYGDFEITPELVAAWRRNLNNVFDGQVPVDLDHSADKGRGTEAAGWIKDLRVNGDQVLADIAWTPLGAAAIKEQRYRFMSVAYVDNYSDEHGLKHGPALIGAGMTNRPALRMPPVTLDAPDAPPAAPDEDAPAPRVDQDRAELDRLAKAYIRQNDLDPGDTDDYVAAVEAVSELGASELQAIAAGAPLGSLPVGNRAKPRGDVDEHGYVVLDGDPDEIIADTLAAAQDWRTAREQGLLGGNFADDENGRAQFLEHRKVHLEARRDFLATLQLSAWEDEQRVLERRQRWREARETDDLSRKARVAKAKRELLADMDTYAEYLAGEQAAAERRGPAVTAYALGFDEFRAQRAAARRG